MLHLYQIIELNQILDQIRQREVRLCVCVCELDNFKFRFKETRTQFTDKLFRTAYRKMRHT